MNTKKTQQRGKCGRTKEGILVFLFVFNTISLLVSNCFPAFVGPAWSAWGRGREFWTPTTSKLQLPCTAEKEEEFSESRERKDVQRKKNSFFLKKLSLRKLSGFHHQTLLAAVAGFFHPSSSSLRNFSLERANVCGHGKLGKTSTTRLLLLTHNIQWITLSSQTPTVLGKTRKKLECGKRINLFFHRLSPSSMAARVHFSFS